MTRPDDGPVPVVVLESLHEGPVDLQDIDGKLLEIGERCIPGAEIVDPEGDPK
jgi:hypothetical protein